MTALQLAQGIQGMLIRFYSYDRSLPSRQSLQGKLKLFRSQVSFNSHRGNKKNSGTILEKRKEREGPSEMKHIRISLTGFSVKWGAKVPSGLGVTCN